MPNRILFPEFINQFEPTKYPFVDDATLTSTEGQAIDKDLFLDASLYPIGATGYIYISEILVQPRNVRITIADQTRVARATGNFDPLFAPSIVTFQDSNDRPAGILLSDTLKLSRFTAWRLASHTFNAVATTFVPSCVIPTPEVGVRGIVTERGDVFTGDFVIVGDNGVVVREESSGCIRIDIVGNPLFRRKLCVPAELFTTPRFVKTINGCGPDKYGNYNITVGNELSEKTILRVYPTTAGLIITAAGAKVEGST